MVDPTRHYSRLCAIVKKRSQINHDPLTFADKYAKIVMVDALSVEKEARGLTKSREISLPDDLIMGSRRMEEWNNSELGHLFLPVLWSTDGIP